MRLSQQLNDVKFPQPRPTTLGLVKKLDQAQMKKIRTELEFMMMLREWWREFEHHEVDEWLKLDGRTVVDPHPKPKGWAAILERWRATA